VRTGQKRHARLAWPKLTIVCHTRSHLWAAAVAVPGPCQDSPQFPEAVTQAASVVAWDRLLADAGYDAEHNHRLAREDLRIRSTVIALNPRNTGRRWPRTRYRRQMKRRFHRRVYRHRAQVESSISRHKRRLGAALRARGDHSQPQESLLRVLVVPPRKQDTFKRQRG
jgi:ribosomal protein L22